MYSALFQLFSFKQSITRCVSLSGLLLPLCALGVLVVSTTAQAQMTNTALGEDALATLTFGEYNTAIGYIALYSDTEGDFNTALGAGALAANTTGDDNTAIGFSALHGLRSGSMNTALGTFAAENFNVGSHNIVLGHDAGKNLIAGSNNIYVGNPGGIREGKTIRIGVQGVQTQTFIGGISGTTVPAGVGVIVGTGGKLGTIVSSARFKDQIKPMDKASEAILALKPVTFRYKQELDPDGVPQFGLIAEEVEKVNPALVARDEQGKPYAVRYEAVNTMLLNEFLKEHRKVQALELEIAQQRSINSKQQQINETLTASLKEQATQIQKVSAQLEASKSASPLVVSNK